MKKFTIYFMIHLLGLAVISFIFMQILKKDIPDNKPFELEYKNEIVKISREDIGTPVIDAGTPTSFAFGVGFLWSEDRIIQLHLWKSLFQGNIAYTINNDSLIKSDIILKSLQIDSLSKNIYSNLSEDFKEYLFALTTGFNTGMQLRMQKDELPFLFLKLKTEIINWQPSDFISLMITQSILTGIPQNIYENSLLNSPKLPAKQKLFLKNFLFRKIELLPTFSKTLFLSISRSDSSSQKLLIFEKNILPVLSYPIKWKNMHNKFDVVFSAGTPLPYYINRRIYSRFNDYSKFFYVQYAFLNNKNLKRFSSHRISVKQPNGNNHWSIVKKHNSFNLITGENGSNLACKLNLPPVSQWDQWFNSLFNLNGQNKNYNTGNNSQYSFIYNEREISANTNWLNDWNDLINNSTNKDLFQTILTDLIKTLPDEEQLSDKNVISILNLMKFEKSFDQKHSILPLLWKEYICYLNTSFEYAETSISPLIQFIRLPSLLKNKSRLSVKEFADFINHIQSKYSNEPENWQWEKNSSLNFQYMFSNTTIDKIMSVNPFTVTCHYGFGEKSILPLSSTSLLINTISLSSDKNLFFNGNWNEQLNHPDFWKFNQ